MNIDTSHSSRAVESRFDTKQNEPKMENVIEKLKAVGQEHILKFYDELNEDQKAQLVKEIEEEDWQKLSVIYKEQVLSKTDGGSNIKPHSKIDDNLLRELPSECIEGTDRCSDVVLNGYRTTGMVSIGQGKVAALLLAGGQGTRLGVNHPKGMFDIGLPTHKSLFQLQAERILKLSEPLEMATGQKTQIIWYIMTSGATMGQTKDYFELHNFFGLSRDKVVFFEQNTIPCLGFDGKVLMDQKHKVSKSPNGNGGLYEALHQRGILDHMISNGVEYVHVYCVDNVLVRVCDPTFMGYCISRNADAGAKVVEKVMPEEAVGIICKVNNRFKVIEYSEISDRIANKRDEATGKLAFNAGNICDHFFKIDFLKTVDDSRALLYHLAIKKVPHISLDSGDRVNPTKPNGIKLERFIFDVFEFTDNFVAWEVKREDEFSPLKNAIGTPKDNPTTALKALLRSYELGLLTC